jgi:hypothetical protein
MPRFLAPITVANETVTGSETISGNQIILSGTYGKDSYWTSVSASGGLSADHGSFVNNVSALAFYGDGSHLTGISASGGSATDATKLSLSGGVMTGPIYFGYNYGPRIDQGRYDTNRGGLSGISLVCSVDYDLNWQAGWLTVYQQDRITPMPFYIDSGVGTTVKIWDGTHVGAGSGIEISHTGITFPDNTVQTTAFTGLPSYDVDNWNSTYSTVNTYSGIWSTGSGVLSTGNLSSYSFFGDNSTVLFNLSTITPQTNASGYLVSLNGATQIANKDYKIVYTTGTNKLSTLFVPPIGCELAVTYLGSHISSTTIISAVNSESFSPSLTGNWEQTYNTVSSNSSIWSNWSSVSGDYLLNSSLTSLTGNWQQTYNNVSSTSSVWSNWSSVSSNYLLSTPLTSLTGNWEQTYNNVSSSSSRWNAMFPSSGGTINGNILLTGSLSVLSGATYINTIFTNTSSLCIHNIGIGPALYVSQGAGPGDIASFYDGDGVEVLHIGNALNPVSDGVIGIKTSNPNKTLTVAGEISASSDIWASKYYGDGSNLTNLDANDISQGKLNTNRLPDIATFNTSVSAPTISGSFYGDGANLSNIKTSINYVIDGGGVAILSGSKGFIQIPSNFKVKEWSILADNISTSFIIDVRTASFESLPTTVSIVSGNPLRLTNQIKNNNLSASWTDINAGEYLEFYVTQASNATLIYLSLNGIRS